jgi:glutaredoxin
MQRRALLLVGLLPWVARAATGEAALPTATDLRALAAQSARTQAPIVLLFTTPGCPYCLEVRRSYLAPRLAEAGPRAPLIREIDITSDARMTDFDGRATTQAAVAARYGVRIVPVVMAVDVQGRPVGTPLIGLDRSGFYDGYLQSLLDDAQRQFAR